MNFANAAVVFVMWACYLKWFPWLEACGVGNILHWRLRRKYRSKKIKSAGRARGIIYRQFPRPTRAICCDIDVEMTQADLNAVALAQYKLGKTMETDVSCLFNTAYDPYADISKFLMEDVSEMKKTVLVSA